jgi:hypothetical protein
MSVLQAEVYEAFRVLDVPDDKALRAAVALSAALAQAEENTSRSFSKRDADIEATRTDVSAIKTDISGIHVRLATMTGEINLLKWMMGTTIALLVTVLFRVFTH